LFKPKGDPLSYRLPHQWGIAGDLSDAGNDANTGMKELGQGEESDNDESDVYEVEKIVAQRTIRKGKKRKRQIIQYKIRWLGYESDEDLWMEERRLGKCQEVLARWKGSLGTN